MSTCGVVLIYYKAHPFKQLFSPENSRILTTVVRSLPKCFVVYCDYNSSSFGDDHRFGYEPPDPAELGYIAQLVEILCGRTAMS